MLIRVKVLSAGIQDRDGGRLALAPFSFPLLKGKFPRLKHLWVDGGYRGEFEEWVKRELGWRAEVVKHKDKQVPGGVWMLGEVVMDWGVIEPPPEIMRGIPGTDGKSEGFRILPRRWVVERTFGWLGWYRRLSKDYEYLPQSSEAMIYGAMSRLMVRRLRKLRRAESNHHTTQAKLQKLP